MSMLFAHMPLSYSHPSPLRPEHELALMLESGLQSPCVSNYGQTSSLKSASKSTLILSEQAEAQDPVQQNAGSLLTILSMMVLTYSLSRQAPLLFTVLQRMLARQTLLPLGLEAARPAEDVLHSLKASKDVLRSLSSHHHLRVAAQG